MSKDTENNVPDNNDDRIHPNPHDRGSARIFKVNIDESELDSNIMPEKPDYKGEVYFINHKRDEHSINTREKSGSYSAVNGKTSTKKKKKRLSSKSFIITIVSIIVVATILLSTLALSCFNDILPTTNRSDAQVLVKIPNNATTSQIIDMLDENGLIKQRTFCKLFMSIMKRMEHLSSEPVYLGGTYYVSQSMGLERMINEFKEEQTAAKTVTLMFPEGWTIYQIFNKLEHYEVCKADHLYTAIDDIIDSYDFTSKLGDIDGRYSPLEGYFFPDTYEFYVGENANSVLKRFLDNFKEKWTDEYSERAKNLGLSIDEVINIASIIQKEAADIEQMSLISSVIHNRLDDPVNFPTIDCDSTYEYISNYVAPIAGNTKASALMKTYNTYICVRLPAGPICSPGIDAIEATLKPADTDYFFFQHDKSGKIYMAKTADEHENNSLAVAKSNSDMNNDD